MNAPAQIDNDGLTRFHDDVAASRQLPELNQWMTLAESAVEPNVFLAPQMLLPALKFFDADNRVFLFQAFSDSGELIGLIPVVMTGTYRGLPLRHLTTWRHQHSFLGSPLVSPGHERTFWTQFFSWADCQPGALFLRMEKIGGEGALAQSLAEVCQNSRRFRSLTSVSRRAVLQSDLDPKAYFERATRSKKRKKFRSMMKHLRNEGEVSFARKSETNGLGEWLDEYLKLENSGWKGKEGTAIACCDHETAFFEAAMRLCAQHGMLDRVEMRLDGEPIALLLNLRSAPGAFGFKTTYDEVYARFSPGVQLEIFNLNMLEDAEIAWTDSCAAENHPMIDHIWTERREIFSCNIGLGGSLQQSGARVLSFLEDLARRLSSVMRRGQYGK